MEMEGREQEEGWVGLAVDLEAVVEDVVEVAVEGEPLTLNPFSVFAFCSCHILTK